MPRKLKKCNTDDCNNLTHGLHCLKHRYKKKKSKREYAAEWQRKRKYNLDDDEFYAYWIVQKGLCAICETPLQPTKPGQGQSLSSFTVDHSHRTGKVRGLLCSRCNKGLGFFQDNIKFLENAKEYLCLNEN